MDDYICHYGIRGQKWGVKNGPPYPLKGGDYSATEKKFKYQKSKKANSAINKKHFDKYITKNDSISTLSYNKDRLKDAEFAYATYKNADKSWYKSLFNAPIKEDGVQVLKYDIKSKAKNGMKIASEDSSVKVFRDLYKNNRDFYNFVNDPERLEAYFGTNKMKFGAYREAKKALDRTKVGKPTDADLRTVYRMFNYILPSDGTSGPVKGERMAKDIANQRKKLFKELKKQGYSGLLDTNDALYGSFRKHTQAPVIIFDMSNLMIDKDVQRVSLNDKRFSDLMSLGRMIFER